MSDDLHTPEGLPEGSAGDSNAGTIDNLVAALGSANEPYRPDGLHDQYAEKSNKEIIDGLLTENTGFRKTQGADIEKAPEDISGYKFEPNDAIKAYFPEPAEGQTDPRIDIANAAALKAGINNTQLGTFLNEVYGGINSNDAFPRADQEVVILDKVDQAAIYKEFGVSEKLNDDAGISKRVDELTHWGKAYVKQSNLPEGSEVEVEILAQTAGGLALLSKLQSDMVERGVNPGGDDLDGAGMTDDEHAALGGKATLTNDERSRYNAEVARRAKLKATK